MVAWQCETCGAVYAEYVNGCPKCWHGDGSQPDPEVRSKVVATTVDWTAEAEQKRIEIQKADWNQIEDCAYHAICSCGHRRADHGSTLDAEFCLVQDCQCTHFEE